MHSLPPTDAYAGSRAYNYFKKHCPNQAAYQAVIDQLIDRSAAVRYADYMHTSATSSSPNKVVNAWQQCLDLIQKDKTLGRPLLGLRILQFFQFGSSQGWLNRIYVLKINHLLTNCGLIKKNLTPEDGYAPLKWMYENLLHDNLNALPHRSKHFELILDAYCHDHQAALAQHPTKLTKLASAPVADAPLAPTATAETTSTAKKQAATALQSHVRRWHAHQKTIFPQQIAAIFNEKVLRTQWREPLDQIVFDICRQISQISADPEAFRGKNLMFNTPKRVKAEDFWYSLYECEIRLASDGQAVKVLLTNLDLDPLATGEHKIVSKAQQFSIPLNLDMDGRRRTKYTRQVIIQQLKELSTYTDNSPRLQAEEEEEEEEEEADLLFISYDTLERIKVLCPEVELVKRRYFDTSLAQGSFNELFQPFPNKCTEPWFNCDLKDASESMQLPLDFNGSPSSKKLHIMDFLPWFIKIARQLGSLHKVGMLHLDAKRANILLKEKNGMISAYLTDWDLALGAGAIKDEEYFYWVRTKIATPCDDIYTLALALVETMIPEFHHNGRYRKREHLKSGDNRIELLSNILLAFTKRFHPNPFPLGPYNLSLCPPSEMLTRLCKAAETEIANPSTSKRDRKLLQKIAVEAFAAQLSLDILDKALEMEDKAIELFAKEPTATIMKEGSLCDKLIHLAEVLKGLPLVSNFPEVLIDMQTQLTEYANKL